MIGSFNKESSSFNIQCSIMAFWFCLIITLPIMGVLIMGFHMVMKGWDLLFGTVVINVPLKCEAVNL